MNLSLATALRDTLQRGYTSKHFITDLLSAFVVSMVALPLSMALAIAVGLPPQHGLYTAIVAGIITPLLGGSRYQVSGPAAAFVVIIAPMVASMGLAGLIAAQVMAGVFIIVLGVSGLGKIINYVPYPVTTGFTGGIAVVIATLSLNDFLGLGIARFPDAYVGKVQTLLAHLSGIDTGDLMVGAVSLGTMILSQRFVRRIPAAAMGILAGTLISLVLAHQGYAIDTIASRFGYVAADGTTQAGIPPYAPTLSWAFLEEYGGFTLESLRLLLAPAVVIAALAALESLLSASVADSMTGTKHNPGAELKAVGMANVLSGLFQGMPATGVIARTATAIKSGAHSPLAPAMHAVLLLLYMLFFARYIGYTPMASLSALLLVMAWHMSHIRQIIHILKFSDLSDRLVLLTCLLLTVFIDMVAGVIVGLMLACLLFMKRMIDLTHVELEPHGRHHRQIRPRGKGVFVYRIQGPLFFGTAEKALDEAEFADGEIRRFVMDLRALTHVDVTGLNALKSLILSLKAKGIPFQVMASPALKKRISRHMGGLGRS